MTTKQKQQLLDDMLREVADRENYFPIIDEKGVMKFPVIKEETGVRYGWDSGPHPFKYRGLCLEVNDHGNVTVWNCFKNGNRREIASRV